MAPIQTNTVEVATLNFADEALSTVTIEDLHEVDGGLEAVSSTHNCGGTFGTATCPASVGTAFSFT